MQSSTLITRSSSISLTQTAHAVYGDHIEEFKTVCKMLKIDVKVLGT